MTDDSVPRPTAPPAPPVRRRPTVVEATVTAVRGDEVEVRLADGSAGVVPRAEFDDEAIAVEETVHLARLARSDGRGRAMLSRSWARTEAAWDRIDAAVAAKESLVGPVSRTVKGGVVVDLGVRAFLPVSLIGEGAPPPLSELVGTEVEVLVTEADRSTERLVVSARDAARRRRRAETQERLRSLRSGDRVRGTVVSTAEHGAIVDLGGVRGLVHRSELTWGHLGRVEDHASVGEEIEVVVLDVVRSKRRVSLSLRATAPDPFEGIEVGAVGPATVTRVLDYGAFARLDPSGAEGLIHVSELSDLPGQRADQLVIPGDAVQVKVLAVDPGRRRLSLSVKQVLYGE